MSEVATSVLDDQDFFRLGYQLAALQLNAAFSDQEIRVDGRLLSRYALLDLSLRTADEVLHASQSLLVFYEAITRRRRWRPDRWQPKLEPRQRRLERFLVRTVIPSTEVMVAGALRALDRREEADQLVSAVRARPALSYRVYYNLACFEATASEDRDEAALDDLRTALRLAFGAKRTRLVEWARVDPSLESVRRNRTDVFKALLDRYTLTKDDASPAPEVEA
jgi:hypothetical protein